MKEQPKLRAIIQGGCYGCWYDHHKRKCPRNKKGPYLDCVDRKVDSDDVYIFIPINYLFPVNTYEK